MRLASLCLRAIGAARSVRIEAIALKFTSTQTSSRLEKLWNFVPWRRDSGLWRWAVNVK